MDQPNSKAEGPQPIRGVMDGLLEKLGLNRRLKESQIKRDWVEWVGPSLAEHALPYRVINKKLVVYVDNSVWLAELNRFYKGKILKKIQSECGQGLVEEVIFKMGELPKESS